MPFSSLLQYPKAFFDWWFAGLADFVPERIKHRFEHHRGQLLIKIIDDEITLTQIDLDKSVPKKILRFDLDEHRLSKKKKITEWLKGVDLTALQSLLWLPGTVLSKVLSLPMAAEENLRDVVTFALERETPFRADQIYFDCHILERNTEQQRLRVKLVLVPNEVIDPVLPKLKAWGLEPEVAVFKSTDDGDNYHDEIRLFRSTPAGKFSSTKRLGLLLGLLAMGLLAIAIALPIMQKKQQLSLQEQQISAAQPKAEAVAKMRTELQQLSQGAEYLVIKKNKAVPLVGTLEELAKIIPNSAWVNRLQLTGNQLRIQGEAATATTLIEELESSKHFSDAAFSSPVQRNVRTGKEQFNLTAEVSKAGTR